MAEQALEAKKRGNTHFSKQEFSEAVSEFSDAIKLDPSQHVFYSNRSACYVELGKFDDALNDAEKCIEIKSDWPKGYSRKGCALFKLDRFAEAKKAYETGLEFDKDNAALKNGLSDTEQAMTQSKNPFAKMFGPNMWTALATHPQTAPLMNDPSFVQKARMLQQNPQQAMQFMQSDPQMMLIMQAVLGLNMSMAKDTPVPMDTGADDSTESEDKENEAPAKKAEPEKPLAELSEEEQHKLKAEEHKKLGNELYKTRKFDEAIEEYTKAIELAPTAPVYLSNRSAVHFMKKDYESCISDCKEGIKIGRENYGDVKITAKLFARLGDVATRQDNIDEAIEYFNSSLLENSDYSIRKKLKAAESRKRELEHEAYQDPEVALQEKEKGNKFFGEQRWKDAIDAYTESLKRNPMDHKVYSNRAGCYNKLMAWDLALEDCNKCIELDPTFAKGYLRKGKIEHFMKEYQKALSSFNKGLECEPNSTQLLEAKQSTMRAISTANMSGQADPERQKRAMQDPEVQKIMKDPNMQLALQQMQEDPSAAMKIMQKDPSMAAKLETLMAAGIISMR
eukprot:36305_1